MDALKAHHRQLLIWAEQCPENFDNRAALAGAELARLENRDVDAGRLYEQAIRSARASGFVHSEALACEIAARFYVARDFGDIADMYLARARDGYLRWGADGKVRQLEARYPQLVRTDPRSEKSEMMPSPDQVLDVVVAVVKASQALSSDMLLPRLIERLMTIAIQNAGADRGLLILLHENDYRIEAEARANGEQVVLHYMGAEPPARLFPNPSSATSCWTQGVRDRLTTRPNPGSLLRRSHTCVASATAIDSLPSTHSSRQTRWSDCFIWRTRWRRTRLHAGIARGCLELLGSQAAISLENTRLFGDLQGTWKPRFDAWSTPISSGLCIFDLDRRIIEANDAFLSIVGYSRDDVISGCLMALPA